MEKTQTSGDLEKRRMFITLLILTLLLACIAGRLFWLQFLSPHIYTDQKKDIVRNSVIQRQKSLVLTTGRGNIYDRKLRSLTGEPIIALAVFPDKSNQQKDENRAKQLAAILKTDEESWTAFVQASKVPRLWSADNNGIPTSLTKEQAQDIESLQLSYSKVVYSEIRYPDSMTAKQLIGFIGENPERIAQTFTDQLASGELTLASKIGGAGLEKTFEPWLRGVGATSISYFTDNANRMLEGLGMRLIKPSNSHYPLKVITTIDMDIQQKIEALMDKLKVKEGAVVVLDAEQSDIRVMASRPAYNPDHIDLKENNWSNHALKAMTPGSIFKTVVAAAALDEGVVKPDETFNCEGALGKYGFTCWKKEGHGHLTLEEGFAESCNIVFAEVMKRLSSKQLELYARKLGLLTEQGWSGSSRKYGQLEQLDAEEKGQLFASETPEDEGVRIQTAIGQRDVRMTPLQAANMVVTLLHGGEVFAPRVATDIRYQTDQTLLRFPVKKVNNKKNQRVSAAASRKILKWMETVVTDGTGKGLQGGTWELAGKSGTAQVRVGEQEKVNQWFIGFGPTSSPKYAVAVVVEHAGLREENKAIPLFKGIMQILADSAE
ncbi:peptidoglycan D,D-transpeptidase FtsI family protein [Paenibacillus eucommiae]|uniref:Cell division protein FtsI/penicillin-binding protein 2 n=1 Tax=Paenibacillus eucommiae TaxID=1355755 RepID=A0ABS4ISB8_9BACL|nr:penicillin-binding protein 2 [Paenibacillus eucommiae]MBP1989911.1 cell division protein FtsI/penicillin-binding protein 2 [Paenibacillus eucommiae]